MGRYRVETLPEAKEHLEDYKKAGNKIALAKIKRIYEELEEHPQTGIGNPKLLKHHYSGYWSRDIDKKNRMIYAIKDNILTVCVIRTMGHYGDK